MINWFDSYISNRKLFISVDLLTETGILSCGVPLEFILGSLLFFIYVNDLPQLLSKSSFCLYDDDRCIFYKDEDIQKIKDALNKEFSTFYEWFDNKLSIHFEKDKTNCILYSKAKCSPKLNT